MFQWSRTLRTSPLLQSDFLRNSIICLNRFSNQLLTNEIRFRALAAGMLVGFGGVLTTSVGFDMGSPPAWMPGQGMARFLSGAVGFPLTIIMVTMSGQGAWTVDTFLSTLAFSKGKRCRNIHFHFYFLFISFYLKTLILPLHHTAQ